MSLVSMYVQPIAQAPRLFLVTTADSPRAPLKQFKPKTSRVFENASDIELGGSIVVYLA